MNAGSVGDAWSTTIVVGVIVALVALGVALIVLAVWVVRTTRVDAEALVGLEEMGTRRWRRGDVAERRQLLVDARGGADDSPAPEVASAAGSLPGADPPSAIDPLTSPEPVGE